MAGRNAAGGLMELQQLRYFVAVIENKTMHAASRALGLEPEERFELAAFAHTFTHYRLHIKPWLVPVRAAGIREDAAPQRWVPADQLATVALPAPVKKLLLGLVEAGMQEGLFRDG